MKPVVVDTGFIIALFDRSERSHIQCKEALSKLPSPLVTCEAVIAEVCYLFRKFPRAVDAVLANVANGSFQIPFDLTQHTHRVRALLRQFRNVPMDFADACLVCLAEELETGRILTLDSDFEVYRWGKNRTFENLLF